MNIDTRLLADCHRLGTLERATVLLHRHSAVGWLILVPDTDAQDWHELDDAECERVNAQVRALCGWAADGFSADKMNVATLGNEVAQMHIHIIARHRHDACWPAPVWGRLPAGDPGYDETRIAGLRAALSRDLRLVPAEADDA
ncbi:HIT domain-containing protein [Salinisphaera sp. LB1]|uniref:HIT domain-containing protein n=1 Tax=Salinisphaera sp. LB1 TaxID=2183911 RepID=UPI000D7082EF|nr:HIT family protein [Salinisphaera sp. LB1]AWN17757.1 Diadenosine tetraphosphate (Ap4A) hydrolase and other HIT family hydrolase [Salinisphaera sp. LB1]